jgi:hypothetical protein
MLAPLLWAYNKGGIRGGVGWSKTAYLMVAKQTENEEGARLYIYIYPSRILFQ